MSSYALLAHTAANTVAGGTSTAGADNTFAKLTLNTELADADSIVSLSSNAMTFASTGNYQINAQIGFGYSDALNGVAFRAGLYNVTSSAFVTQAGGASEILSVDGLAPDPVASSTGTMYVQVSGRFTVANASDTFAIYGAGKAAASTWYSQTFAQGAPAASITSGAKSEIYKLVEIIKE
jgi:hypothetical protein